jgi:hypothetical protein
MKSSFISLYQEPTSKQEDNHLSSRIRLGTQTRTDSREQSDQDPSSFGTQTQTRTRENTDTNSSYTSFSIVPRV